MDAHESREGSPRRLSAGKLRKERRALNATETEESYVVQYLVLGGHRHYVTLGKEDGDRPWLAASGVHAGAGRQVFGWSEQQRCDLMLAFLPRQSAGAALKEPSRLYYHNHHGSPWHYSGHQPGCPLRQSSSVVGGRYVDKGHSKLEDDFRRGLAQALSQVAPHRALFFYTVSTSCQLAHGMPVPALTPTDCTSAGNGKRGRRPNSHPPLRHGSAKECLALSELPEVQEARWLPSPREFWDPAELVRSVAAGRATGFVTLRGGRESPETVADDPAGHRFGFCVQKYAPSRDQLGEFTLEQIRNYQGWRRGEPEGEKKLDHYLSKLEGRTLCASTFLSEETVSTTYLAWLMAARGFKDFEVTHFLEYRFRDWAADFLGPVLQRRHDCKRAGDAVAAECLKLIGNGSYGYNGLEACNYSDLKIMTDRALQRRYRSDMAHRRLQHVTFLGVVREQVSRAAQKKKNLGLSPEKRRRQRRPASSDLLDQEAVVDDNDDPEGETEDEEEEEEAAAFARRGQREGGPQEERILLRDLHPDYLPDDEDYDSEREADEYSYSRHRRLLDQAVGKKTVESFNLLSGGEEEEEDWPAEANNDLEESLIVRQDAELLPATTASAKKQGRRRFVYRLLYAVTLSGEERLVVNSLPRAVAVLSNSKRLFLGHLELMFRCLDPRLAELCYVDTDSCVWSLSRESLELCLRHDRRDKWNEAAILADEMAAQSCHGKMKLEGTYQSGIFRTVKMYRLFLAAPQESESANGAVAGPDPYTRCKGVHRKTARNLNDSVFFQTQDPCRVVVHRSALRPSRAGEIHLTRESKSLAVPFNLKRRVDPSGTHTVCFGAPISSDNDDEPLVL